MISPVSARRDENVVGLLEVPAPTLDLRDSESTLTMRVRGPVYDASRVDRR